jgi:soluble lytic murein transglycosylase
VNIPNWEQIIRGSWSKLALLMALSSSVILCAHFYRSPAEPVRHKKSRRKPAAKKSRVAESPKVVGAAGLIAVAQHQLELGEFPTAAKYAVAAAAKAPMLNDYAQYIRAQAEYKLKNYSEVAKAATQVFNQKPLSPLIGSAAALAVSADLDSDQPKQAFELVKKYFDRIPQPQATLLMARCFQANGDSAQAAEYFQRVYYNYPVAKEATDAANALVELKARLGEAYPPVMPTAMLGRAEKLFQVRKPADAAIELAAAIPQLGGAQRDLASVRLGEADFFSGKTQAAFEYLTALKVNDAEADAERLCYLIRSARKLDRNADVKSFLNQLEQQHPTSPWRLDALIFTADQARTQNDAAVYLPLYRACAASFTPDPKSAWCHWRVTFESYRKDSADAFDLLRGYIQRFPSSPDTPNAIYFLGRLSERNKDMASARACYDELIERFPNTYFGTIAQERLKSAVVKAATPGATMLAFLRSVPWPPREDFPSFDAGPAVQRRLDRAHLLEITGLNEFAENELKFGVRNDGEQQNVFAFQLAKLAAARGAPDQAMRYIKAFTPSYLYTPLDEAPLAFWQLAFPIPFRNSIEQRSSQQGLDPFLIAALIRQESEFDAKVISHSDAYGLMQLLPSTGRQLARHFGVRHLPSAALLTADRNIQLGTYYFRNLLNSYGGQMEIALASYNAGPGHANVWRTWGPFREPAEFIETVPFHETRGYVQIVLRNADVYRRLYAGRTADVPVYHPKPAPKRSSVRKKRRTVRR